LDESCSSFTLESGIKIPRRLESRLPDESNFQIEKIFHLSPYLTPCISFLING
jgi:hypothetical protein